MKVVAVGSSLDKAFTHFCITASWFGVEVEVIDLPQVATSHSLQKPLEVDIDRYLTEKLNGASGAFVRDRCPQLPPNSKELYGNIRTSLFERFASLRDFRCINPITARSTNYFKFNHLENFSQLAKSCGVKVPRTILSNQIEDILAFCASCGGSVIIKGASSQKTIATQYTYKQLERLECNTPIIAQECISGDNIRVHMVGPRYSAERIRSADIDYRLSKKCSYSREFLHDAVVDFSLSAATMEGLVFSGIDFISNDRDLYFLEVNSDPDYRGFDKRASFQITRNIIKELIT